ncbi:hypothetical protein Tsubulata_037476 [Turnera subulata]|uniref:C2H2-type domain-containing protein n=1 Tax=Turnera subulata TaxID=218843 RepID=A0A9Q0FH79_9ROSI|nr:hypothetical protein Tsubulata_037476 [Turnera subulata]
MTGHKRHRHKCLMRRRRGIPNPPPPPPVAAPVPHLVAAPAPLPVPPFVCLVCGAVLPNAVAFLVHQLLNNHCKILPPLALTFMLAKNEA